jgi:hypothetical protein
MIQGRPVVAFAFLVYKFTYRLMIKVLQLSNIAQVSSRIDKR